MITAGIVIARDPEFGLNSGIYRFIVKEKNLTGIDIVTPNNMRLFARRALERGEPLPISISIGTHPIEIAGAGYRAPLGTDEMAIAGGLARRAGRARAMPDHRPALHRRCRDRAGSGNSADRLDLSGRPLRRIHPPDGRAALESAGARQSHRDEEERDLLQPAHAVGEHLARGADALCRDPPGAEDRGRRRQGHQRDARRLRLLARGDLDQEAARRRQECASRRAVGDGSQTRRRRRRRYRRVRSDRRGMGDRDPRAGRPRHHDRRQCPRQAARSEPAARLWRGADRRQGRHRRHHPGRHSDRALRAHHLCLCRHARISTTT